MDDARVQHHRRPDRFVLALDREVRVVDVRQAGDLRPEIEVQEALLRVIVLIISRPDLAEHVIAHGRGRAEEHDARVEAQCEAALVAVDVAHGGQVEGQLPQLVEVRAHERVAVDVHDRLDPGLVEPPDVQLRVLVEKSMIDAAAGVRWRDALDGLELPPVRLEPTQRTRRDAVREVEENPARGGVHVLERLAERENACGVCLGIE